MRMFAAVAALFLLTIFSRPVMHANVFDSLTNELNDRLFAPVAGLISAELAQHMGFYTGSGNTTWASPAPFLGLRTGIGIGINLSQVFRQAMNKQNVFAKADNMNATIANNLSTAVALFPFPYDMAYLKMGLPELPIDLGIRFGFIPVPTTKMENGITIYASAIHFGAEARKVMMKYFGDFITINGSVSFDYSGGGLGVSYSNVSMAYVTNVLVGTNYASMGIDIGWGGVSIGCKGIATLNIPVVGGLYAGLGLNINLGGISSGLTLNGSFKDLTGTNYALYLGKTMPGAYNFLDIRALFGFQLLFVNFSLEYGVLNKDLAVNLFPIALSF